MSEVRAAVGSFLQIEKMDLQAIIDTLLLRGFRVIGPRVRDGAVVLDDLACIDQLPRGWLDDQDGGITIAFAAIPRLAGSITLSARTRSNNSCFLRGLSCLKVLRSARAGNSGYPSRPSAHWQCWARVHANCTPCAFRTRCSWIALIPIQSMPAGGLSYLSSPSTAAGRRRRASATP